MQIFEFFWQYPLGYFSHWSQGFFVGILMSISVHYQNIALSLIGVIFALYFALYESLEFARTNDFGDVDVENWYLAFIIGCLSYFAYYFVKKKRSR